MYIQITTRCNMSCEHCGMNCTAQGEDMSFETFKAVIQEAAEMGRYITLGGGEPTIHPEFEKFLLYAIAHCEYVHIITNGKLTDKALAIAKLSEDSTCFNAELSQDPFHDPIDQIVIDAFGSRIRDTSDNPINAGRCNWGEDNCICEDIFVAPDGDIHQCGCDDSPRIGNIFEGYKPLEDMYGDYICHKKIEKEELKEAA